MYYNQINYDLLCNNCNKLRLSGVTMLKSEHEIDNMPEYEMIDHMNNFKQIQCDNCGKLGNWEVLRIYFNDNAPDDGDYDYDDDDDYDVGHNNYNEVERDIFDALTDGQYGDYEDFRESGGDIDNLKDALGL